MTSLLYVVGEGPRTLLGQVFPPNVLLALAILGHRPWCPDCAPHAAHLIAALLGYGIEDIAHGGAG